MMKRTFKLLMVLFACASLLFIFTNPVKAEVPGNYYKDNKLYEVVGFSGNTSEMVKIGRELAHNIIDGLAPTYEWSYLFYDYSGGNYYNVQCGRNIESYSYGSDTNTGGRNYCVKSIKTVCPFYFVANDTTTTKYYELDSTVEYYKPTKDNHLFVDWYTTSAFVDETQFAFPYTITSTDITKKEGYTLYARFIPGKKVGEKILTLSISDQGLDDDTLKLVASRNTDFSTKNSYLIYKENSANNYSVIETNTNGVSTIVNDVTIEQLNSYLANGSDVYVIGDYTKDSLTVTIKEKDDQFNSLVSVDHYDPMGKDTITITATKASKNIGGNIVYYIPYTIDINEVGGDTTTVYPAYDYQNNKTTYQYTMNNKNVDIVVNYIEYYYAEEIDEGFIGINADNISNQNKNDLNLIYNKAKATAILNGDTRDIHIVYEQNATTDKVKLYPNIDQSKTEYSILEVLNYSDSKCIVALGGAVKTTNFIFHTWNYGSNYLERAVNIAKIDSQSVYFEDDSVIGPPSNNATLDIDDMYISMNDSTITLYDTNTNSGKYTFVGSDYCIEEGTLTANSDGETSMTLGDSNNQAYDVEFQWVNFALTKLNLNNVKDAYFYDCTMNNVTVARESNHEANTNTAEFSYCNISGETALDVYGSVEVEDSTIQGNIKVESGAEVYLCDTNVLGKITVEKDGTIKICGGYYSEDPSAYLEDGYICVPCENGEYKYCVMEFNPYYNSEYHNANSTVLFKNNLDERSAFKFKEYFDYEEAYYSDVEYYIKPTTIESIINDCRGNIAYNDCMAIFYVEFNIESGNLMKNNICLTYDVNVYGDVYGKTGTNQYQKLNTNKYTISNSDFVFDDADDCFYITLINPGLTIDKIEHVHDNSAIDVLVCDDDYEVEGNLIYIYIRELSKFKIYQNGVDSSIDEARNIAIVDIDIQLQKSIDAVENMKYLSNTEIDNFEKQIFDAQTAALTAIDAATTVLEINSEKETGISAIKTIEQNASSKNDSNKNSTGTTYYKVVKTCVD